MIVQSLVLKNFRNYGGLEFQPAPGLSVLFGPNGAGKTNILEALVVLALTRSNRAARDEELVSMGQEAYYLRTSIERSEGPGKVEVAWEKGRRKQFKCNGAVVPSAAGVVGRLLVVFFGPDELQIAKGAPAMRRRYLDIILSQVSPTYLHNLTQYARILGQRNKLLRSASEAGGVDLAHLKVWDDQLVEVGSWLVRRRAEAVARLADEARAAHAELASEKETLSVTYDPAVLRKAGGLATPSREEIRAAFFSELERLRPAELARGVSLAGPHRDDLLLGLNGADLRDFGSQGQTRTAALALKFAELSFLRQETGEEPVMLLDDVLSELDESRRQALAGLLEDDRRQAFVTTTDEAFLPATVAARSTYYRVGGGRLVQEE